jgi:hypothetical protein
MRPHQKSPIGAPISGDHHCCMAIASAFRPRSSPHPPGAPIVAAIAADPPGRPTAREFSTLRPSASPIQTTTPAPAPTPSPGESTPSSLCSTSRAARNSVRKPRHAWHEYQVRAICIHVRHKLLRRAAVSSAINAGEDISNTNTNVQCAVSAGSAKVISISFGECEGDSNADGGMASDNKLLQTALPQGQARGSRLFLRPRRHAIDLR